jgi:hypothetical protein
LKPERQKYQFSIIINNETTNNSAATKAVLDCRKLFTSKGYQDYTLYFSDNSSKVKYSLYLVKEISGFLFRIKKGSIVGVQYPILNNVFKYFIKIAKLKNISFFCVIHDIESLRLGGKDTMLVAREAANFNHYDCLIVHNTAMLHWLKDKGVITKMIPLTLFDYLADENILQHNKNEAFSYSIVFAGNLAKSAFVYQLSKIPEWQFHLYGPNFSSEKAHQSNVKWQGEFAPDEVVFKLEGSFGLIWDGDSVNGCDEIFGNYLQYNNPHKLSLYLAAGIPVIAPVHSAIAKLIKEHAIGILIESLYDLKNLRISKGEYEILKNNCKDLQRKVITGSFFAKALETVESEI